jgi:hypothetical protein
MLCAWTVREEFRKFLLQTIWIKINGRPKLRWEVGVLQDIRNRRDMVVRRGNAKDL